MAEQGEDLFKVEFKRYKKHSAVDFADVIDFTSPEKYDNQISCLPSPLPHEDRAATATAASLGLKPPHLWKVHGITSIPGLLVIPDPFLRGCQHRWVRQCLVHYPCKPNVCNLDAHLQREGRGEVWPGEPAEDVTLTKSSGSVKKMRLSKDGLLYRLRWVTLGYHYDWNTKEYNSHSRSPFPEDLALLAKFIMRVAGFPSFEPEAAIVNYYHLDSTLSGHTDHSEKDLSIPLFSLSFGQSAIFLIGGRTKQVRPKTLLLRSGDVIIMSCDSRLAYHGVPRVLPPPPDALVPECLSLEALQQCAQRTQCYDERSSCSVCGREGEVDPQSCGGTAGHTKTPEEHVSSTDAVAGTAERMQHCAADKRTKPEGGGKDSNLPDCLCGSVHCLSCQELACSWPKFVVYLSVSRINVNIRQVVSENFVF